MNTKWAVFSLTLILTGCISNDIHRNYRDSTRISIYDTSCKQPFLLTKGCLKEGDADDKYRLVRASIPVTTSGSKYYISSTEDGRTIYIGFLALEGFGRSYAEGYTFGALDHKRDILNNAIDSIKALISSSGAERFEVIPVTNFSQIDGYFITSDTDIYSLLIR
ncbi:hypothetical protein [Simiduia agarivorans]|uniref:Lipoprotein n=1 Tax=Simiduia agarivorans (strain DSM 21679 / JCM 13881 / BCRC 17597 / SA1) TaxID=1117647 RepID=K4KLM8_SIMAS|nr:hypothetical protein [Simiduia agarivorans]AFU99936.1 hypothetical protein M5M_13990 [Simiduia agarivorans SA1 = DSM 21679]